MLKKLLKKSLMDHLLILLIDKKRKSTMFLS